MAHFVQHVGDNFDGSSSNDSVSITLTSAVAAGNKLLVGCAFGSNTTTLTVTDSRGNTYTQDVSASNGLISYIFSCDVTTALQVGDTITATANTAIRYKFISVDEFSNMGALDQTATATGADVAVSIGPTPTTTEADEVVFASISATSLAGTFTPGTNYTGTSFHESAGRALTTEYQEVSATGQYTADGTWADAANWAGIVATYKGVTAGGTQHTGAASLTITPSITTVGSRTAYGSVSDALTFSIATAGKRTAYGAVSFPITLGITTAGSGGHTEFGSASLALDLAISTAGKRTAHGTVDTPLTLSVATQGSRTAHGAVSLPISLGITTVGTLVNPVRFGSASFTITPTITTEGSRTAKGASSFDITIGLVTRGRKHAYRSVTMPIALTITTGVTHSTKAEKRAQKRNELAWMKLARRDLFR